MIKHGYDLSSSDSELLCCAIHGNRCAIVDLLLRDCRVEPHTGNNTALRIACYEGFIDIVERLLQDPRVSLSLNDDFSMLYSSFPIVVDRLFQEPSVFWRNNSEDKNCPVKIARVEWYRNRSIAFSPLHMELVATVIARNEKST